MVKTIVHSRQAGILLNGSSNSVIEGNLLVQNSQGVAISNSANNNIIGGTTPAARNVISGNGSPLSRYTAGGIVISSGSGNIIEGNFITGNLVGVVASADITIGGTSAGARNIISGNAHEGVLITGGVAVIQGNYIGTDVTGTAKQGNGVATGTGYHDAGIYINIMMTGNATIGGTSAAARHVISGNAGDGVHIEFSTPATVLGNFIGTDATGTNALGNGKNGVMFISSSGTVGGTTPGAENLIAFNGSAGISGGQPTILSNSIFYNGGLGIDRGGLKANDPDDTDFWQNYPVLTSVSPNGNNVNILGTLNR